MIYANLTTREPAGSSTGDRLALPVLVAGGSWKLALRFTQLTDGVYGVVNPAVVALRASLGAVDGRPGGGTFRLEVSAVPGMAGTWLTSALDWNAPASMVKDALNAAGGPTDFRVEQDAGSWLVSRANGAGFTLTGRSNKLRPVSFVRCRTYELDGEDAVEVRLVVAPLAFEDTSERILPEGPSVATVMQGYTDPSGTWMVNEVQELVVPREYRGAYQLIYGGDTDAPTRTRLLSDEDGAPEIEAALNAVLGKLPEEDGLTASVTVENPSTGVARITFGGALAGVNVPLLRVVIPAGAGPEGDLTMTLDLNRHAMWAALREQAEISVPFELEAEVWRDPADEAQGTMTMKLWQEQVTIRRPLLWEGLAASANVDWLRPVNPVLYPPYSPNQIVTGNQHYVSVLPLGTSQFVVDHNLETEAVHVTVRENVTPGLVMVPQEVRIEGPNSVRLTFGTAQLAGAKAVLITSAGPTSQFLAHTHTLAEIPGLAALLEEIGGRVAALETLVAVSGSGATTAESWQGNIALPAKAEVYPALVTRGSGTTVKFLTPPLPRAMYAGTTLLAPADSLPDAVDYPLPDGAVIAWGTASEVYAPGGPLRKGRMLTTADCDFILGDGYFWYGALKHQALDVYYPNEMDRVLWELAVTPEMLSPGRKLRVDTNFLVALVADRPELQGNYLLRVRKGLPASEVAFGTAPNIREISWDQSGGAEDVMLEQKITLTSAGMVHQFAIEVSRAAGGALSASKTLYGKTTTAPAPQSEHFMLRAELCRFDLTNYAQPMGLPLGQVYLLCAEKGEAADAIRKKFPQPDAAAPLGAVATLT